MKTIKIIILLIACTIGNANAQAIYDKFPETFQTKEKLVKYSDVEIQLNSGLWRMKGTKILSNIKGLTLKSTSGKYLQFESQQKGKLTAEMKFDLSDGASKVVVSSCSVDEPCKWVLESSSDKGKSWKKVGKTITSTNTGFKDEVFNVQDKGNIRFRVVKLGLGNSKNNPSIENGRLIINSITIYK